jgi:cell division inhibitor SepF
MSTIHKFKAYFGMVPPGDYEDDYLDEPAPARSRRYERDYRDEPDDYRGEYADEAGARPAYREDERDYRDADFREGEYERVPEYAYAGARRPQFESIDRYPATSARVSGRLEPLAARTVGSRPTAVGGASARSAGPSTRGALAIDPRAELDRVFEEGNPLGKITTLRPSSYAEARTIGERFRDGSPVIMDLVEMSNADAKRLVDFAAGLAFALHGSFDKVATKVFLLAPADIDVSPEDRKKIAETGFYNHQ